MIVILYLTTELGINHPSATGLLTSLFFCISRLEDIPRQMKEDFDSNLYKHGMARNLQGRIQKLIGQFEEYCGERLLPDFQWEIHFHGVQMFSKFYEQLFVEWEQTEIHNKITGNNPVLALREMKEVFLSEDNFFKESKNAKSNLHTINPI